MKIRFGAGYELGPDFTIVLIENLEAALDVRPMKHAGVGDEDHFDVVESETPFYSGTGGEKLVKIAIRCGLAVAGEGNVVEPAEFLWRVLELRVIKELAAGDQP